MCLTERRHARVSDIILHCESHAANEGNKLWLSIKLPNKERKNNQTSHARTSSHCTGTKKKTHLAKVTMAEFLDKGNARPWDFCCQALVVLFVAGIGVTRCIMVLAGLLHISCIGVKAEKKMI